MALALMANAPALLGTMESHAQVHHRSVANAHQEVSAIVSQASACAEELLVEALQNLLEDPKEELAKMVLVLVALVPALPAVAEVSQERLEALSMASLAQTRNL